MSKLTEAIAEDIGPDSPDIRTDAIATRPGHSRSKVLQVRLNEDEYDAIAKTAELNGLPISTVARAILLEALAPGRRSPNPQRKVRFALPSKLFDAPRTGALVSEADADALIREAKKRQVEETSRVYEELLSTLGKLTRSLYADERIEQHRIDLIVAKSLEINVELAQWLTRRQTAEGSDRSSA